MIRWKVELSNGEVVEEGMMPWIELPGERKPWPRLCAYLEEYDLHVTKLSVLSADETLVQRTGFESCFVEYDLEIDNVFGGPISISSLHVGFYFNDRVEHIYIDMQTGKIKTKTTDTYKAMCPSRKAS